MMNIIVGITIVLILSGAVAKIVSEKKKKVPNVLGALIAPTTKHLVTVDVTINMRH